MKPLAVIIGIVLAGVALTVMMPRKDLVSNPQERVDERLAKEAAEAAKAKPVTSSATAPDVEIKPDRTDARRAVFVVEGKGEFEMELYPKAAPNAVAKFVKLIEKGYYDGMKVHRVEPDFVVQAGEPGSRTSGFGDQDFASSTFPFDENSLQHVYGTVGVALTAPKSASGSCQWFVNTNNNHSLDGNYCVMGQVTKGMDNVKKIQVGDVIKSAKLVK
jgi:cyclophilin family peptidyl-prolyl cis-trans isomerase